MRGVKNQDGSVATPQQIYDAFMGGGCYFVYRTIILVICMLM